MGGESVCLFEKSGETFFLDQGTKDNTFLFRFRDKEFVLSGILDEKLLDWLSEYNSIIHNRTIMQANLRDRIIEGNRSIFGRARVFKNFDTVYFNTDVQQ